jgi:phospholipid/cholesterol/gamma-HCH transport system substrate-binding protein
METKANYVAVGAFVLSCAVALTVALLWLAGEQFANEFTMYRAYFQGGATGLGQGTTVRYNGIEVGVVSDVAFDPDDPRQVIVDLQVDPELQLRQNSLASLEMQGLTGGIYVQITGGTADAPFATAPEGEPYPVLQTQQSAIQQLFEGTPELLTQLTVLAEAGTDLLSAENRAALSQSLANIRDITGVFNENSDEITQVFTELGPLLRDLDNVLISANTAIVQFGLVANSVDETAHSMTELAAGIDRAVTRTTGPELEQLLVETRELVTSLSRLAEAIEQQPTQLIFGDRREGYSPQ